MAVINEPALIRFRVIGTPQPRGSKNSQQIRRGGVPTGRNVVYDSNPKSGPWMALVAAAAAEFSDEHKLLTGPLHVELTFFLARPKGHYGSGRNAGTIRPSAPGYPIVTPDVGKLARGTIDALKGVLWRDDAQIVTETHRKRYETPEGCYVVVKELA